MSWSSWPAIESTFWTCLGWVLRDCWYCFPCGLDRTIGHSIASISEHFAELSINLKWPVTTSPVAFMPSLKVFGVGSQTQCLWVLGQFSKRAKRVEESRVWDSRAWWRLWLTGGSGDWCHVGPTVVKSFSYLEKLKFSVFMWIYPNF